jgi:hypothetical protein
LFTCVGCKAKPALSINEADAALSYRGYTVKIEYGGEFDDLIDIKGVVKKSLHATKGTDSIDIYEFENRSTARRAYKLVKKTCDESIATWKAYIKFYEHILDEYYIEMSNDEIEDIQEEVRDYQRYLKRAEDTLKAMGRKGRFVWFASDESVVEDTK